MRVSDKSVEKILASDGESVARQADPRRETENETMSDYKENEKEPSADDYLAAETLSLVIEQAARANASDIHIEPRDGHILIRYRIDGLLKEARRLPDDIHESLIKRVKKLSHLKINERRLPQDGKFKIQVGNDVYDLRASTLPIREGEKVVLRARLESSKPASLKDLGFWGYALKTLSGAIAQPHGIVVVAGPAGSGKSASLFSLVSLLNKPSVNISTIEDPIEYKIAGANQTEISPNSDLTMASGLRSLLLQDPNIIMVGKMRDRETADLAVQAAMSGRLIFAALFTNGNAAATINLMLHMGVEPFLVASTIRSVVGQRLARRLCDDCKESYRPDEAETKLINKAFCASKNFSIKLIHDKEKEALEAGIGKADADLSVSPSRINRLWRPASNGCERCGHSGYKGRVGLNEVLSSSQTLQKLIVAGASSDQLEAQALKDGMIPLKIDGLIKALRGLTSVEEVLRVVGEN